MKEAEKLYQSKSGNQSEAVIWQEKKGKILENLRSYSTQEQLFKLWKNKYESVEDLTKNQKLTSDKLQSIIDSQPDIDFSRDKIIIEMQNRIHAINTLQTQQDFDAVYPNPDKEISFLDSLSSKRKSQIQQIKQLLNKKLIDEAKHKAEEQAKSEAKAKLEAEARAKLEAEAKVKREAEAKVKREAEAKAKLEAEARAKLEAEEKAKAEAEERAKLEAEERAQKAFARQQRRAEYLEKINLEKMDGIISEAISKIEDGIVNELASKFVAEEVSRLEEEDRIKSKTVADAVDRIENKIIDELLPEFVNKVVDELVTEYVNKVVDELVTEYLNEALAEIVVEALAEVKAEEKTKIEAEERSRLKDQIRAEIESEVRAEIELRVREELEVAHKNEIMKLKARFDSDIKILNDRFRKEMETAQNEFEDKAGARMAERDRDRERDRNIDRDRDRDRDRIEAEEIKDRILAKTSANFEKFQPLFNYLREEKCLDIGEIGLFGSRVYREVISETCPSIEIPNNPKADFDIYCISGGPNSSGVYRLFTDLGARDSFQEIINKFNATNPNLQISFLEEKDGKKSVNMSEKNQSSNFKLVATFLEDKVGEEKTEKIVKERIEFDLNFYTQRSMLENLQWQFNLERVLLAQNPDKTFTLKINHCNCDPSQEKMTVEDFFAKAQGEEMREFLFESNPQARGFLNRMINKKGIYKYLGEDTLNALKSGLLEDEYIKENLEKELLLYKKIVDDIASKSPESEMVDEKFKQAKFILDEIAKDKIFKEDKDFQEILRTIPRLSPAGANVAQSQSTHR